jgi:branched-chain amino acid transport system ATP-binding protein
VILRLEDVHAYYGDSHILQGVSLQVAKGEIVCLLGRNGVGKTTTLRSIMGLVSARRGLIELAGTSLTNKPTHSIARAGVGYVPEERRMLRDLTVIENLRIASRPASGGWGEERVLKLFPRLAERVSQLAGTLSGGEQQILAIGRALMGNPKVLLLDEPSQGLAPQLVQLVAQTIRELHAQGLTIVLVEQNVHLALELGQRHYVLAKGQVVHESTSTELRADPDLMQQLLGV